MRLRNRDRGSSHPIEARAQSRRAPSYGFPKGDRSPRLHSRWQRHALAFAGGLIRSEDDLQNGPPVLARLDRLAIVRHAVDEMRKLLRKAVVPQLFPRT